MQIQTKHEFSQEGKTYRFLQEAVNRRLTMLLLTESFSHSGEVHWARWAWKTKVIKSQNKESWGRRSSTTRLSVVTVSFSWKLRPLYGGDHDSTHFWAVTLLDLKAPASDLHTQKTSSNIDEWAALAFSIECSRRPAAFCPENLSTVLQLRRKHISFIKRINNVKCSWGNYHFYSAAPSLRSAIVHKHVATSGAPLFYGFHYFYILFWQQFSPFFTYSNTMFLFFFLIFGLTDCSLSAVTQPLAL